LLALSACADGKYPSLAQRPAERRVVAASPAAAPVAAGGPGRGGVGGRAGRANDLAGLLKRTRTAHDAFLVHLRAARPLVDAAHDAPVGSASWLAANEALAELDTNRSDTVIALDQVDQLYVDDRVAHALEDGDTGPALIRPVAAAIGAARDSVLALIAEEDDVLADLKGRLPE
jgi:hypothetical protein